MQTENKETKNNNVHKEKEYSIFQITFNLAIACLIAGIIIAITYYITAPIAAEKVIELNNQSMRSLVKDADTFSKIEGKEGWYTALKDDKKIAYIVPSESKGYGGAIKLLVAITPDGKVIDYSVVSFNETPGLGDGIIKDSFRERFNGKKSSQLIVVKDPSKTENIQAISGATISSRAVTKGIKEAVDKVMEFMGGN